MGEATVEPWLPQVFPVFLTAYDGFSVMLSQQYISLTLSQNARSPPSPDTLAELSTGATSAVVVRSKGPRPFRPLNSVRLLY